MNLSSISLLVLTLFICLIDNCPTNAQSLDIPEASIEFDVDPTIIENSPVIQEWIQEIPDISEKIRNEPSFPTLVRFGYSQFPSNYHSGGIYIGVEDVFLGQTPLTFSGEYNTSVSDDSSRDNRLSVGGNLKYYLLPLGNYVNIAPIVGYKYIETGDYHTDGLNVGVKLILALSPKGAADVYFAHSFISPTSDDEVAITELGAGYAITESIRLSAGIKWQNSIENNDSQVNIGLEWIP